MPVNLRTIEALLDHRHAQELSARRMQREKVFRPSPFEAFKI